MPLTKDQQKKADNDIKILLRDYPESSDFIHETKINILNEKLKKSSDPVLKYELNYFIPLKEEQEKKANNAINSLLYEFPESSDPRHQQKIDFLNDELKDKNKASQYPLIQYQLKHFKKIQESQKTTLIINKDDMEYEANKTKKILESEINSIKNDFDAFWSKSDLFNAIITLNIDKINDFAVKIFILIQNILSKIGNSLYNFIQTTLTTYSLMITMIFFILFVAILLFSKDKFGNILVLFYFYTGFLLTGFFVASINWIMILYNKTKKLVLLIYEFVNLLFQDAPLTLDNYWTMIKDVFWIIITIISICFTLLIFFWTAIAIEFLTRLANSLFITIDQNTEDSTLDFMEILGKIYDILKGTFNSISN